jgi:hypothetical protein
LFWRGEEDEKLNKSNENSMEGWRVAQVVEYLPSKCEALSSNPCIEKKKKSMESIPNRLDKAEGRFSGPEHKLKEL